MLFCGTNTDAELEGDLRVQRPFRKENQNLTLAIGERLGVERIPSLDQLTVGGGEEPLASCGSMDRIHEDDILDVTRYAVRADAQESPHVALGRVMRENKYPGLRTGRSHTLNGRGLRLLTEDHSLRLTPRERCFESRLPRPTIHQQKPVMASQQRRHTDRDDGIKASEDDPARLADRWRTLGHRLSFRPVP